jgi:Family of unknown function (DUF5317)
MLLLVAIGIALALMPVMHGDLRALAMMRVRLAGLVPSALVIQVLVVTVFPGPASALRLSLFLGSYLLGLVFVYLNLRLRGLWLVGVGAFLNLLAIVSNGGVMPATRGALATAGIRPAGGIFANSASVAHPHLWFLGDVFAIPSSWPLANVFSVGDVLIAVGTGWAILAASRRPRSEPQPQTGTGTPAS